MRVSSMLAAFVLFVAALAVFVRWLEPRFAFFPSPGEDATPRDFGVPFDSSTVATADGERLRVWRLHAPAPRALVVYFHGNGGNLSVWAPIIAQMAARGYEAIAFDYRGYGLSTGRPSERGLYRDVDAVLAQAAAWRVPRVPIVYWGRSLGTTMAAYAAATDPPDGVVLEAGFPDSRSLVRSSPPLALLALFSSYRFPTASYMKQVRAPVLVMHGTHDSVVPYPLGRALFDRVTGPKTFVEIAGGDHNDIRPADERTYWDAVERFVSSLSRSG